MARPWTRPGSGESVGGYRRRYTYMGPLRHTVHIRMRPQVYTTPIFLNHMPIAYHPELVTREIIFRHSMPPFPSRVVIRNRLRFRGEMFPEPAGSIRRCTLRARETVNLKMNNYRPSATDTKLLLTTPLIKLAFAFFRGLKNSLRRNQLCILLIFNKATRLRLLKTAEMKANMKSTQVNHLVPLMVKESTRCRIKCNFAVRWPWTLML